MLKLNKVFNAQIEINGAKNITIATNIIIPNAALLSVIITNLGWGIQER
jgi:hypothetical protein